MRNSRINLMKTFRYLCVIGMLLFGIMSITGTGGGGGGGGGSNPPPATADVISIFTQSPTYKTSFATSTSPVIISGLGIGNIKDVAWNNVTSGENGAGTGTATWSVSVPLEGGDNQVEIKASPVNGDNDITLTLTVVYNTSVNFTSLPTMAPDAGLVGTAYDTIYVRVGIDSTDLDKTSIKVYKVDDAGAKTGDALGTLTDDGSLANGDEIEGDGVYSAKIALSATEAGPVNMRIFASDTGAVESKTSEFSFVFFDEPTDEALAQQATNDGLAKAKFDELTAGLSPGDDGLDDALDEVVTYIKGLDGVVDAGRSGYGVWWLNGTGIFSTLTLTVSGSEEILGGRTVQEKVVTGAPVEGAKKAVTGPAIEYLKTAPKFAAKAEEDDEKYNIGSTNAVHVSPYESISAWYTANAGGTGWFDVVKKSDCPAFNATEKINAAADPQTPPGTVPLDAWKTLSNYGLISTLSHGDTLDVTKKALEDEYPQLKWVDWLFPWHGQRVVIHTNIQVEFTKTALAPYLVDLLEGRLMLWPAGGNKVNFVITPEFISYYNGSFPNSIWVSMECRSAYNDTLAAVFRAKGGGAYYGYSDYVEASYAFNTQRTIFEALIKDGKNCEEAFDAAVAAHGANDGQATPAALVFYGEKKTKIGPSELKNPSFEDPKGEGSLAGWTIAGDARAIKVLGDESPTDGGTMAIISTGLGFTTSTGSISQSFCLPEKADELSFDWNFYSEEFKEYCSSSYDDKFLVSITEVKTAAETVLFSTSVNTLCDGCPGGSDWAENEACNNLPLMGAAVSFDRGDVWYTGWNYDETIDVSAWAGKAVVLKFYATDVGDSIYDTAILIDNLSVTETE